MDMKSFQNRPEPVGRRKWEGTDRDGLRMERIIYESCK
jgi:hypothetical protein